MIRTRMSVSVRFLLVMCIGLALQAGISLLSLIHLRQSLIEDRKAEVKHLLETAYSLVEHYHQQAVEGALSEIDAQQAARDALRELHYDQNNYFFVWSMDGAGVAHGAHPEWEGHNLLLSPDKDRLPVTSYMVRQLIETCQSAEKEGYAFYKIPRKGETIPLDKIAYTRLFEPWGWSVGTGAYVDDIDATFRRQALSVLLVHAVLIAIAGLVAWLLGGDVTRALTKLAACVSGVARGEFEGAVPGVERRDEVGVMARALLVLRDNSREMVELRLDTLTGLPNRRQMMDRLRLSMAVGRRLGSFSGLLLVDIDKLKSLNDAYGHDLGDMILRDTGRRLSECLRPGDLVARLGGDEFVVILADLGLKQEEAAAEVESLCGQMLASVRRPLPLGKSAHTATASAGMVLFRGEHVAADDLIMQANLALARAKQKGRNTACFFDPVLEAAVHDRARLEVDLRRAVAEEQFLLHFQPQVDAEGRVTSAEVLLRWMHPERGLIAPGAFIPLAEETGLIQELGHWVARQACRQLKLWDADPATANLKLSVNVSTLQFQRPDFVEQIKTVLDETGAVAGRLVLELTESLLVENVDDVVTKMLALRARGVGFSLDDFGTGYSSLNYLKRLPLDQLKIDRSFVRDILTDPSGAAIARSILALADALRLHVLAEGVETAAQRELLLGLGCRAFQGHLFSEPVALHAFEKYLSEHAPRREDPDRGAADYHL